MWTSFKECLKSGEVVSHLVILLLTIQVVIGNHFEELHLSNSTDQSLPATSNLTNEDAFAEADKLYETRGSDISNANKAVEIYKSQLDSVNKQNALRYIQLARMEFYIGQFMETDSKTERLAYFKSSYRNARKAGKVFHQDFLEFPGLENTEALIYTEAIYVYTLGLSQWAKRKGTFVILNRWPEIRDINQLLIDNEFGHIDYFGPYRVIGLAHNEMPAFAGGQVKIARKYLKIAFENTRIDKGCSAHMYNNIAYATRLLKDDKREQACKILIKSRFLFTKDFENISPERVPESLAEKKTVLEIWRKNKCFQLE